MPTPLTHTLAPLRPYLPNGSTEQRFNRETIFGAWRGVRGVEGTADLARLPHETTWDLMTTLPGAIEHTVGNTFGLRTWIVYGFKQGKDEAGWADHRLTSAASIARWWKVVMCAYLLISLQAPAFALAVPGKGEDAAGVPALPVGHPAWAEDASWTHRLNYPQLLLQRFVCACLLLSWLRLYSLPHLAPGLADRCAFMNIYHPLFPTGHKREKPEYTLPCACGSIASRRRPGMSSIW